MINAIRLLLLLVLSLQTATFSRAIPNSLPEVSTVPLYSFLKSHTDPLSVSNLTTTEYMAQEADSMDYPCDLAENEKWDTALDEGLQETLHFNVVLEGDKNRLPHSEQQYNFFIRYGIPPPEAL